MHLKKLCRWGIAAVALLALIPAAALRLEDTASTPRVEAHLLLEHARVPAGGETRILLRLDIIEHWHTYWLFPGESGEETRIELTLPDGVSAGPLEWAMPERVPLGPVMNFGYEGQAHHLLALSLDPELEAGTRLPIHASARWLVCEEECIPETAEFTLELEVGPTDAAPGAGNAFEQADARLPLDVGWTLSRPEPGLLRIDGEFDAATVHDAYFFADTWGRIEPAAAQHWAVTNGALEIRYTPGPMPGASGELSGVLEVVERDGPGAGARRHGFSLSETGNGAPGSGDAGTADVREAGFALALLLAFLGGILLNLMPCVFPVLSVKLLALTSHAHGDAVHLRRAGYAWTAGVLTCFALIGAALLALRAGGSAVGWGFQLQEPLVIGGLALLFFWLGLALSGQVEIGTRLMGLAGGSGRSGRGGHFMTGLLAAVVATPCTAPFMGAAVGWAVLQPAPVAMAVLLALGAGMAAPFLALCFAPGLLRRLPRPGPWMARLKEAMAFPLYASAVWLVWVLARQAGADAVAVTLCLMLLIALGAWLGQQSPRLSGAPAGALVLAAGLLVVMLPTVGPAPAEGAAVPARVDADRIERLRADGHPVFLNLTAAWCVTCLVNERVALSTDAVQDAFRRHDVTYLEGDWTHRDPAITALLEQFGRAGVPLYVIYPPGATGESPRVLPQMLTPSMVVSALEQALGKPPEATRSTAS